MDSLGKSSGEHFVTLREGKMEPDFQVLYNFVNIFVTHLTIFTSTIIIESIVHIKKR